MKHVAILGSTGSIGKTTLNIISKDKKKYRSLSSKKIKLKHMIILMYLKIFLKKN